jgi:hypothetical protein
MIPPLAAHFDGVITENYQHKLKAIAKQATKWICNY